MKKRRLLVVGLGSIGQRHVRNLRTLCGDTIDLSAFRVRKDGRVLGDRMSVVAESGLDEHYGIRGHSSLRAALDERPDAVLVCNPTKLHLPVAYAAAERGAHLFIEKPLSHDLDGTDDLVQLARQQRLVVLVGFQMRFHPCFREARRMLSEDAIGRVVAARLMIGEWLPGFHPWEDYRTGYAAREDLGGGVVLTLIHEIDAALALFGMPKRVFSLGGHRSSLELNVEDFASTLLDCEVRGRPVSVHVQQDYLQLPGSRRWEILGDAGRIEIDLTVPSLTRIDREGTAEIRTFPGFERNTLFLDEMRHFLACLDGCESPVASLTDAIASQLVAGAIHESIVTGKVVGLA